MIINGGKENIIVVDQDNIFGQGVLEGLNQLEAIPYEFTLANEESKEDIVKKVENKEINTAVIITPEEGNIKLEYIVDSLGFIDIQGMLTSIFSESYKNIQLINSGLTIEQLSKINEPIVVEITELKEGSSGGTLAVTMIMSVLLFYAVMFCAYQVSHSITTEKTSKIIETLVTSTKPRTIVVGKTVGIGIVGILQVIAIMITAFISYQLFFQKELLEGFMDISKITPQFIILVVIYFILGYIFFAFLYALTGSTVAKPEDVQSSNGPVSILLVIGFYMSYFSMLSPTSSFSRFTALFPLSAPFSMPFKIVGNTATAWDIVLSIGLLILTIWLIANIAIKIYSNAILHYGNKLTLKDIFKIYKQKN